VWQEKDDSKNRMAKLRRGSDARRDLRKPKFTVKTQVASSRRERVRLRLRGNFAGKVLRKRGMHRAIDNHATLIR
jgi:hypothetical protein